MIGDNEMLFDNDEERGPEVEEDVEVEEGPEEDD